MGRSFIKAVRLEDFFIKECHLAFRFEITLQNPSPPPCLPAGRLLKKEGKYFPLLIKGDERGLDNLFQSA